MKILELTRAFYPSVGGLEKFVFDRLKIYKDLGIDYKLITTNYSSNKIDTSIIKEVPIILKQYTPYNITPKIKKYIDYDYNVLSINLIGRYYSDYAILYAKRKKKKVILTPHFTFHTGNFNLIKRIHRYLLAPKLLNAVDKIVCFTQVEKKFWIDNFNITENKIEVIPHYVKNSNEPKNSINTISGKFLFYLGRYDKNKRVDILIEAFTQIKNADLYLYLTIEEGNLNNSLKKIVKQDPRIRLLGTISEEQKTEYLSSCEAIIFPSSFEAFGTVLLEASGFSKPILCSSLEVFKEILTSDGAIFFQNNTTSIKESIIKFIEKSDFNKKQMGKINFMNCEKYEYQKIKSSYENLYNNLLNC